MIMRFQIVLLIHQICSSTSSCKGLSHITDRHVAFLGLAYQTYKGLTKGRELAEKLKGADMAWGPNKKAAQEQDDLVIRILMKW